MKHPHIQLALAITIVAAAIFGLVLMFGDTGGSCMGGMIYIFIVLGWMAAMSLNAVAWLIGVLFPSRPRIVTTSDCIHCGYNLCGTIEADLNRCPECGREFEIEPRA